MTAPVLAATAVLLALGATSAEARGQERGPEPAAEPAAEPDDRPIARPRSERATDVLVRIDGDVRVERGDTVDMVVVVDGRAVVDGTVREQLVAVGGPAIVSGTVEGGITIGGGRLELRSGARVGGDVVLYRSTLERAPAARVDGRVTRVRGVPVVRPLLEWLSWLAATAALLGLGLVYALLAGRQLGEAARLVLEAPGRTSLAAVLLIVGLPLSAALAFATVIGIPFGLVVLLVILPVLLLLGYMVTGAALGAGLLRRLRGRAEGALPDHPYREVALGTGLLQLAWLIPLLGALAVLVAAPLGAGALAHRVWRMLRQKRADGRDASASP